MAEDFLYGLKSADQFASIFEDIVPELWEDASLYDISRYSERRNEETGEIEKVYPFLWDDEQKKFFEDNPDRKAMWMVDNIFPEYKEKSLEHYIPPLIDGMGEKWKYQVSDPSKQAVDAGFPIIGASMTRLGGDILNTFAKGFENLENVGKTLDDLDEEYDRLPAGLDPYNLQSSTTLNKEKRIEAKKAIKQAIGSAPSDKDDVDKWIEWTEKTNNYFEKKAVDSIKEHIEKNENDPRFWAWQNYAREKPVGWLTTFKSPEYFTDTVFGMIPSIAVTGLSIGAGTAAAIVGGPAAGIATARMVSIAGFMPLEGTDAYTEAYTWTLEETGDEELARANAAYATAEYLSIVAVTEGWGASKLMKRFMPASFRGHAKSKFISKVAKSNINEPAKVSLLKKIAKNPFFQSNEVGILRDAFREGFQEYVQYGGNVLTQMGYKDASFMDIYDPAEAHESVVGGALLGGTFGTVAAVSRQMKWNSLVNRANTILDEEYGINTDEVIPKSSDIVDQTELETSNTAPIGVAKPTLNNYLKELLNPVRDDDEVIVDRGNSKGPIRDLLNRQDNYSKGRILEKIAEVIKQGGKDWYDELDPVIKNDMNAYIRGAIQGIQNIPKDILNLVDNPEDIGKEILNNKIDIVVTKTGAKYRKGTDYRKILIKDQGYIDSVFKMYKNQILDGLGEDATIISTRNFLSGQLGIEVDKQAQKQVSSSIQKHVVKSIESEVTKVAEAEVVKQAEREAEKEVQRTIEEEALKELKKKKGVAPVPTGQPKPVTTGMVGKSVHILEGEHKGKAGKISYHSPSQEIAKVKLEDGTVVGPFKQNKLAVVGLPGEEPVADVKETKPTKKVSVSKGLETLSQPQKSLALLGIDIDVDYETAVMEGDYLGTKEEFDAEKKALAQTGAFLIKGDKIVLERKYRDDDSKQKYLKQFIKGERKTSDLMEDHYGTPDMTQEEWSELSGLGRTKLPKGFKPLMMTMKDDPSIAENNKKLLSWLRGEDKKQVVVSAEDVHKAAEKAGMKWDDDADFMELSKKVTGKERIDEMTSEERSKLISFIDKKKKPSKKVQPIEKILNELEVLDKKISLEVSLGRTPTRKDLRQQAKMISSLEASISGLSESEMKKLKGRISKFIKEDDSPEKKRLHQIGDVYEKGERKATKKFISNALKQVMGPHAPDVESTLVEEIENNPKAVGAYSEGIVEFVLGRATQHTAYHEPIHWFFNRVLSDSDYETLINHFAEKEGIDFSKAENTEEYNEMAIDAEEAATRAAADYELGKLDRSLPEKILDILKRFWIAIKKFLNMRVTDEETIFDIFDRIGRDFTIRNFRDRMQDIGVTAEPEMDVDIIPLPKLSDSSIYEILDSIGTIPAKEYKPQQVTINRVPYLELPTLIGQFGVTSVSRVPAAGSTTDIALPFVYGFSNLINNLGGNLVETSPEFFKSLTSKESQKGLSKYEKVVVNSFYEHAIEAEFKDKVKTIDKKELIIMYEEYAEKVFPLNSYAVRHSDSNLNLRGKAMPTLFENFLDGSRTLSDNFYSARVMITDDNFYLTQDHKFYLDPSTIDQDMTSLEMTEAEMLSGKDKIAGLGWYVYVEPNFEGVLYGEGDGRDQTISIVYEVQRDIDKIMPTLEGQPKRERISGLTVQEQTSIKEGTATASIIAFNKIRKRVINILWDRLHMQSNFQGESFLVRNFISGISLGDNTIEIPPETGDKNKAFYTYPINLEEKIDSNPEKYIKETNKRKFESYVKLAKKDVSDRKSHINIQMQSSISNRLLSNIYYHIIRQWNDNPEKTLARLEKYKLNVAKTIINARRRAKKEGRLDSAVLSRLMPVSSNWGSNHILDSKGRVVGALRVSKILKMLNIPKKEISFIESQLKRYNPSGYSRLFMLSNDRPIGIDNGKYYTKDGKEISKREFQIGQKDKFKSLELQLHDELYSRIESFIFFVKEQLIESKGTLSEWHGEKQFYHQVMNREISRSFKHHRYERSKLERSIKNNRKHVRLVSNKIELIRSPEIAEKRIEEYWIPAYNRFFRGMMAALDDSVNEFDSAYNSIIAEISSEKTDKVSKAEKLENELRKFREVQIHQSILLSHSRGNRIYAFAGAEANSFIEADTTDGKDTSRLYLNEFELNDFNRAKTYEEWKLKSLGDRWPIHMKTFVDRYYGLGMGNHLKSDEMLESDLKNRVGFNIKDSKRSEIILKGKYTRNELRLVITSDEKAVKYFLKKRNYSKVEIPLKDKIIDGRKIKGALSFYRDAPSLGPIYTAFKKVLRKQWKLKPEYKNWSVFKAPLAIVRMPDNLEQKPIKRFHEIEEPEGWKQWINEVGELAGKAGRKEKDTTIGDTIVDDSVNLARASNKLDRASSVLEYFDASFTKIKDKYGIEVSDYVPSMHRALRAITDKDRRNMIRNWLSEWAVSRDPEIATKMRSEDTAFQIVELMGYGARKRYRIGRELAGQRVVENIIDALDKAGVDDSHDISREGLDISDISDTEEIANNMTFEAYDFKNDIMFKFLENTTQRGWLSPKQTADLMSAVRSPSTPWYEAHFLPYLKENFGFVPETAAERNMVRSFWVRNQPINRQDARDKPAWWWANLAPDGTKLKNKNDKRFIPKIGGHPKYGKDLRSNRDLPRTANVSFLDWDSKSYRWDSGGDISLSRIYLKDIVDVFVGERESDGGTRYYSKPMYLNLNGLMVRSWDSKFAQFADTEIGGGLARTIVDINSGGNSPSFIVARANDDIMDVASTNEGIISYFDYEVSIGNMTKKMRDEVMDSIIEEMSAQKLNKHVAAQHILRHEVMKRARGRDYMMRSSDATHHSRRLAIDDGEGIVSIGTGDFTVKIIDQSKLFVSKGMPGARGSSKKIPMSDYIAGLPDKYHGDGSLWVSTELLDKTAEAIGREPTSNLSANMREVKSRVRWISKEDDFSNENYPKAEEGDLLEGTHYVAFKSNEFVPEEDIYITDENDNIILYTERDGRHISIRDGDNNIFDMFGTLDEAKEPDGGSGAFKLNGRVSTDILTLPEESRRIIKIPKQQGHSSAAFPWFWLSHLYHKDFDNLRFSIMSRMLSVARNNIDIMFATRQDPRTMRALMGQFKSDGLSIMSEVDMLLEPIPGQMIEDGFMHPHLVKGTVEPIKNRMLKENSYKGRRRGFGSYPVIKSDLSKTIVKSRDGAVLSADDVTMVRFLKDSLNVTGFGNDLIENINEALRTNPKYLFAGRWPTYSPNSVFLAKVEKVMPHGHGHVVWFHPDTVIGKLQGDHDGDNAFLLAMYFGRNYSDRNIVNLMRSKEVKQAFEARDQIVRLEYFAKKDVGYKVTKKSDTYITAGRVGRGLNSQGILMNAIDFMENMYYKDMKMEIGGQKIVVRDPEGSSIVMKYAKLNDDITQEMLADSKMGVLVDRDGNKWKSGDKYLMTSPMMELRILLQAAVDNAKEGLLADWGFMGYNFLIPKIFIQENGSPIGSKQAVSISSLVRRELMYNVLRRGVDEKTKKSQSMADMFASSKDMFDLNQMSGKQRGAEIMRRANIRRVRFGKDSKLYRNTMEISDLTFNNKLTAMEQLISIPHESMVKYQQANPNDSVYEHPFGYHPNRYVRAIMQTQKDLYTIQSHEARWYPVIGWEKEKQVGRIFANNVTGDYHRIMMNARMHKDITKSRITAAGYPYQEDIIKFIDKWLNHGDKKKGIPSFLELSEEQQAYATLRFLRGTIQFSNKTKEKITKREEYLGNLILNLREKLTKPEISEKERERIESNIEKHKDTLAKSREPSSWLKMGRARDIEKILPMPLMHPGVWSEFINRFGPNLREASQEKITLSADARYEEHNDKTYEQLMKGCK